MQYVATIDLIMSYSDDLEVNPFYNHALNRQAYLQQVLSNGCILCIPAINTLPVNASTDRFLDLHILKPSPLYKGEYSTVWSNASGEHQAVSWDETTHCLTAVYAGSSNVIEVLYSETAYIQGARYTVLLIERPLNLHRVQSEVLAASIRHSTNLDKIDIERMTLRDIKEFLRVTNVQNLDAVEREIQYFKSKYIVLPSFLNDAAIKLQAIADKYSDGLLKTGYNKQAHTALLTYIHHQTFAHVYPHVQEKHRAEDERYHEQCRGMHANNVMSNRGNCDETITWLSEVPTATSPLQLIALLKLTLDEICNTSSNTSSPSSKEPLSSDELIPMLIGVLIGQRGVNFPSLLQFIQLFGGSLLAFHNAFEFTLATFRAAVQYITDYKLSSTQNTVARVEEAIRPKVPEAEVTVKRAVRSADAGAMLAEYVKPFADCQPFSYASSSTNGDPPLDRYALLDILSNCNL